MNGSPIKRAVIRREPSTPRKQVKTTNHLLTPETTPVKTQLFINETANEEATDDWTPPSTPTKRPKVMVDQPDSTLQSQAPPNPDFEAAKNSDSIFFRGKAMFQRGSKIREVIGRDNERALLTERLMNCIKTRTNGAMYVSGLPGTGKSALVSEILTKIQASKTLHNVKLAQINCMTIDKPEQTYGLIAKEVGVLDRRAQRTREQAVELLQGEFTQKNLTHILVMDELDRIVTTDQEILFKIFEWACGSGTNLVVVGIANAIDLTDRFLPRLQAHKLKPEVIAFKPYTAQGITEIIEGRLKLLGAPLMHPAAVRICAAKTAANSGDLRKAFDVCRRAIEIVEEEQALASANNNTTSAHLVTTRHVARVCQTAFGGVNAKERLQLLNFQQRAVLCVLLKTERTSSQPNVTVLQAFQEYEQRCAHNPVFNSLAYPEYMEVVNALESAGLVAVTGLCGKKGLGTHGNVRTSRGGGGATGSKGAEGYRDEFGLRKISSRAQLVDVVSDLTDDNDPLRSILMD